MAIVTVGYELLGEENKRLGLAAIPFLADLCRNSPTLLPKDIRPGSRHVLTIALVKPNFSCELGLKLVPNSCVRP